ncbi:MAG: cytochrome P450 [Acidimicrobiaceae bacterium]|nr:cytochrome P450 [Acidimicrobiaceae bacterium]
MPDTDDTRLIGPCQHGVVVSALPDFGVDPLPGEAFHRACAAVRDLGPVVEVPYFGGTALMLTRYDDVVGAFRDNERFPAGAHYEIVIEPVQGRTFESMDGDEHNLYRQLAQPAFRSRAIERFDAGGLAATAHEVVDGFAEPGRAELMGEFCAVFPFWVISRKLGLPPASDECLRRWSFDLLGFLRDPEPAQRARDEFDEHLAPAIGERRREPTGDVLSALLHHEVDGRRLDDEEVVAHVRMFFAAGAATTYHALGNLLSVLLTRPEVLATAVAEPQRRPAIVEELLRFEPPLGALPRIATLDAEWQGVHIPAGSILLFGIAAANRDPAVHGRPDEFDVDREPVGLISFGSGPHFCPGSHLARRELLTGLDVLLERLPGLHLGDPTGIDPVSTTLRAPEAVHAAWDVG